MPLSPVYAIYAFHTLDVSLNRKKQLSLPQVQDLWTRYLAANPHLEFSTEDANGEEPDDEDDDNDDEDLTGDDDASAPQPLAHAGDAPYRSSPSTSSSSTPSSHSASTASSSRTTLSSHSQSTSSSGNNGNSNSSSTLRKAVRGLARSRRSTKSLAPGFLDPKEQKPLFVTWNDISRLGHKVLRGCIGTFEGQELEKGLRTYALTAALEDTRFTPITSRELPTLSCAITFLTDFEPCTTPLSWELGTHGLRISFVWRNQRLGATYLPSVAVEQGWSKTETLVSLMRKAGWNGRKDEWMRVEELSVVRYRGAKCGIDWQEYVAWSEWCEMR